MTPEQQQLVLDHLALARWMAVRLSQRCGVPFDDVHGDAHLGLCDAATRWNQEKCPFVPYAMLRIRGAMIDGLRRTGLRRVLHDAGTVDRTFDLLAQQLEHEPSWAEIAEHLNWTPARLDAVRQLQALQCPADLFEPVNEDGTVLLEAVIAAPEQDLDGELDVTSTVHSLPGRLPGIVTLRMAGFTLHEIGDMLGVSESRVCQLIKPAKLALAA